MINHLDFKIKKNFKNWPTTFKKEFEKDYMSEITSFLSKETLKKKIIFPKAEDTFNAFSLTAFKKVKVVIIGQDPYHGANQAHGLSFSVRDVTKLPPSLKNIFKELNNDLGIDLSKTDGNLKPWAKQGVLLLNNVLTVEEKKPGSHRKCGWEIFTDEVVNQLNINRDNIVFLLWGADAQAKGFQIDRKKHLVLETSHPSPFSAYRGFLGSSPFSKTNKYLKKHNKEIIDWSL